MSKFRLTFSKGGRFVRVSTVACSCNDDDRAELQGAVHAVDSMVCKTPAEKGG